MKVLPMSLYLFVTYVLDSYNPMNPPFRFVRSFGKFRSRINFFRIEEIDAPQVRPKGEGQGCPESNLLRSDMAPFSLNFPSLAHRVQRGFKKQKKRPDPGSHPHFSLGCF